MNKLKCAMYTQKAFNFTLTRVALPAETIYYTEKKKRRSLNVYW